MARAYPVAAKSKGGTWPDDGELPLNPVTQFASAMAIHPAFDRLTAPDHSAQSALA